MKRAFLLVPLVLSGCASVETFKASPAQYAPVKQSEVLVYFDQEAIRYPYEVIGELLAEGSSGWGVDQNDLVKKAQKKAAQMGANAILVHEPEASSGSQRVMAALFGTNDNKRRVTALRLSLP
jgi:hypothetical protein